MARHDRVSSRNLDGNKKHLTNVGGILLCGVHDLRALIHYITLFLRVKPRVVDSHGIHRDGGRLTHANSLLCCHRWASGGIGRHASLRS